MYATLVLDAQSGDLTCKVIGAPEGVAISYRLMRHSACLAETERSALSSHQWPRAVQGRGGGDFHAMVIVHLVEGDLNLATEWQYVPSDKLRDDYASWLISDTTGQRADLPELSPARAPFESIAYFRMSPGTSHSPTQAPSVARIAASTGSHLYEQVAAAGAQFGWTRAASPEIDHAGPYVLSSAGPLALPNGEGWAFGSGFAFDRATLRRSSQVAKALTSQGSANATPGQDNSAGRARYSSSACGDFLAAMCSPDGSVEFHTDYVGTSAWFVYETPTAQIVASNYLLAVAIARALGENLSLNLATIDVNFTSLTQAFQQPILDELELEGFSILRPDTVMSLHPGGEIQRHLSQLGRDVAAPDRFTVRRYYELLQLATKELAENCAAIADDPGIDVIRCDISGGLDSRMVLAGFLAGPPSSTEKVSLFTETPQNAPDSGDLEVAARISAVSGLPFSDRPINMIGPCTVSGLAQHQVAASFGTYWLRGHTHAVEWDPRTVYVGGAGLDNFARDYSTASWNLVSSPVLAPTELSVSLAKQMFKWRGRASLKAAPRRGVSQIAAKWDELPGDELDKGSQIFNFYRARFHGGAAVHAALGALRMSPGPTRSLHRLRLMAARNLAGPRAQIEIIHRLNPSLAAVPFSNPGYNETYTALYGAQRSDDVDLTQAKEASARRNSRSRWIPCPSCEADHGPQDRSAALVNMARVALHDLGNDPSLNELMLPAFRFSNELLGAVYNMRDTYGRTFVNKILHLHASWRMATASKETDGH